MQNSDTAIILPQQQQEAAAAAGCGRPHTGLTTSRSMSFCVSDTAIFLHVGWETTLQCKFFAKFQAKTHLQLAMTG